MIKTRIDKNMVHVIPIGNKWRPSFYNTNDKYSQRIKNRYDQKDHHNNRRIEISSAVVFISNVQRQKFNSEN